MTTNKDADNKKTPLSKWVGIHLRYPDLTKMRKAEGGKRLSENPSSYETDIPRVSIVTVVYNRADTIERSICSVIDQKYKNVEHIIIDAGSDDGTLDVLKRYQNQIDYFVSEPDDGVYHAMNKGISLATGDYICILNADDFYDPSFIATITAKATEKSPDITCGTIETNGIQLSPSEMNEGIFLGHLNYFHGTFLVSRDCYEDIGPYSEDFKIVSDTLWVQQAFANKKSFVFCGNAIVHFSDGGLSSGNTPERRELLIRESAHMYKQRFPYLNDDDAREIYLFRFSKNRLGALNEIVDRYCVDYPEFLNSLRSYVEYCFKRRHAFAFEANELEDCFLLARRLLESLKIDPAIVRVNSPSGNICDLVTSIDSIVSLAKDAKRNGKQVILHYAEKFSTPSETFIYDLLQRMQSSRKFHNVMLCDERRLKGERPFENCIEIPWSKLSDAIRIWLYERLLKGINPDSIVCHFAASGRWLYSRIGDLDLRIPTIHMTHGIDVFAIDTNPAYRDFIIRNAVIDPQTEFTAVSEYLANELVSRGVPREQVTVVPNTIHPRFFKNRKETNFFDGSRELRILNVGRLIQLKGHKFLIEGFRHFLDKTNANAKLTIVYGGGNENLDEIQTKIESLNLTEHIELVEYVNFNENPDFYARHDLFVLPSTYSDDEWARSESFGMSTLEAIASGLPVIVSDAGGSPEIIGDETTFAKIVPHGNSPAIGEALSTFYENPGAFKSNLEFAQSCLKRFAPEHQLDLLTAVLSRIQKERLKVTVMSSIASGGAGGAAVRVHESLLRAGANSTLITRSQQTIERQVPFIQQIKPDLAGNWDILQVRENQRPGNTIFTVNEPRLTQDTIKQIAQEADVINIQWVARMLSIENIAYLSHLGKPIVITVRDMQPLTGGCHFFHGCEKWKGQCFGCPQLKNDNRNLPQRAQLFKLQNWNLKNITVVALSEHSAELIRKSPLLGGCQIEIIANPIDLETFAPSPKSVARSELGIPADEYAVFYIPSFDSKVKGRAELRETMRILRETHPEIKINVVVAGSGAKDVDNHEFTYPTISLGKIDSKQMLAQVYAAVDATLIPSLEETFSNTAAESVACGTPIVGFKTGAIGTITGSGERGIAVEIGDCDGLAKGIFDVVTGNSLSKSCRKFANDMFSFEAQGKRYKELFESLAADFSTRKAVNINPSDYPLIDEESAPLYFERQTKTFEIKRQHAVSKALSTQSDRVKLLEKRLSHIKALANNAMPVSDASLDSQTIVEETDRQRLSNFLQIRFPILYRVAKFITWCLRLLGQRLALALPGFLFIGFLFIAPSLSHSWSSFAHWFWALGFGTILLGTTGVVYIYARQRQLFLQRKIDQQTTALQNILIALRGSK